MKILHYSLGFPPYSRGGLTKYAIDLMEEQAKQGHWVGMLWPGEVRHYGTPKIVKRKSVNNINSYELKNPEYLPQIYGIRELEQFQLEVSGETYRDFLEEIRPDVIHIHTLMGMHLKFLEIAVQLKIKTIYTSHDFFGICPKSTLYFNGKSCEYNESCIGCRQCCENALSIKKMKILQSRLYREMKNTGLVKKIRNRQKTKVFALEDLQKKVDAENDIFSQSYKELRKGYMEYFDRISIIHFNSSYMKKVFGHYMNVDKGIVCNITHSEINNHFDKYHKTLENNHVEITYLGPIAEYKGFYVLKKALDMLYKEGKKNFTLTIYHELENPQTYMNVNPPYRYENLGEVMNCADIVAVPHDVSYGFTVLEALSYGVPVLVTEEVGAKDLIRNNVTGILCDYNIKSMHDSVEKLLDNPCTLETLKKNVKEQFKVKNISEHTEEIINKIYQM